MGGAGANGGLESADKRPENAGPAQQQQQQAHRTPHVTACMLPAMRWHDIGTSKANCSTV
jgi:hypothetical protein